ncbi:MAG: MOSC domain-containing protein [Thermoplasmata archaeon]|nr:MAG: MOSC domain-containing protein [Thermoplasmata archaeon]
MTTSGILLSINISSEKGEKKSPIDRSFITEYGVEGDAHSGEGHRQVSLLADESIDKMRGKGVDINYGDFAENLTVKGIDLMSVAVGQRIGVGEAVVLEVSQIGKECHEGCAIREQVGDCVMPREGVFAKVIRGGEVKVGDSIRLIDRS